MKKNILLYIVIAIIILLMGSFVYILLNDKEVVPNDENKTTTSSTTLSLKDQEAKERYNTRDLGAFEKGNASDVVEIDLKLDDDILKTNFKDHKISKNGHNLSFSCLKFDEKCLSYDVSVDGGYSIMAADNSLTEKIEYRLFLYSDYAALIRKNINTSLIDISLFMKKNNYSQMFYDKDFLTTMNYKDKEIDVYPVFANGGMYYISLYENKYALYKFDLTVYNDTKFFVERLNTYEKSNA